MSAFADTALERLSALPGVTRATLSTNLPVVSGLGVWDFQIEGRVQPGLASLRGTLRQLLRRPATSRPSVCDSSAAGSSRQTTARPRSPLRLSVKHSSGNISRAKIPSGKRIRVAGNNDTNAWARVVGVVADVRDQNLETEPRPLAFHAPKRRRSFGARCGS